MGIFNNRFTTRLLGLAIVGIVFIGFGLSSLFGALSFKNNIIKNIEHEENIIDFMYPSDYKLNENVCGYINYLYECFCEETTTNTVNGVKTSSRVSGSYYLMPITNSNDNKMYYITVLAKDKDFTALCEQLVDDTYAYLLSDDDIEFTDVFFTGKIKPLESEVKSYLVDWVTDAELFEDNSTATIDKYVLPYQIEEYNMENHFRSAKIFIPIGVVIVAVCTVVLVLVVKKNKKQNEEQSDFNTTYPSNYDTSYKPEEPAPALNVPNNYTPAAKSEEVRTSVPVTVAEEVKPAAADVSNVEETDEAAAAEKEITEAETNAVPDESGMLSATVSAEDVDNLPDDSSAKPTFNYDDGGMGGIDVSALDLSSLDDYKDDETDDEPADNNIYSSDDEEYTFDADPASIQLSDMDK